VQDHDKLELAVTGLPMFAFPNGMRLTLADAGQFPLPLFFTFVFTDADGKHFYVACLQFYEPVTEADLQETFRKVHGDDQVHYMLQQTARLSDVARCPSGNTVGVAKHLPMFRRVVQYDI
jgi:hypothetical protein